MFHMHAMCLQLGNTEAYWDGRVITIHFTGTFHNIHGQETIFEIYPEIQKIKKYQFQLRIEMMVLNV